MDGILRSIVEPGLLSSGPVRTAVLVGTVVAVTSGVVGVFTVIRGQSFAGHSLADVATTGGAGAFLAGISQFWGFLLAYDSYFWPPSGRGRTRLGGQGRRSQAAPAPENREAPECSPA